VTALTDILHIFLWHIYFGTQNWKINTMNLTANGALCQSNIHNMSKAGNTWIVLM